MPHTLTRIQDGESWLVVGTKHSDGAGEPLKNFKQRNVKMSRRFQNAIYLCIASSFMLKACVQALLVYSSVNYFIHLSLLMFSQQNHVILLFFF